MNSPRYSLFALVAFIATLTQVFAEEEESTSDDVMSLPAWGTSLIALLAVINLGQMMFNLHMIKLERSGTPFFQPHEPLKGAEESKV